MHPQNLLIAWFTLANLNPFFQAWWLMVEDIYGPLYKA